jgi:hypothetical protein
LEQDSGCRLGLAARRSFGRLASDRYHQAEIGSNEGCLGALRAANLLLEAGDRVVSSRSPEGKCGGTVMLQ